MDPLEMVMSYLLPGPLVWKHVIGGERWTAAMPADSGLVFGMVLQGEVWVDTGSRSELQRGDYILMVGPDAWHLGTGGRARPIPFPTLDRGGGSVRFPGGEGSSSPVRIMAGHFEADSSAAALLGRLLPSLMIVPAGGPAGGRLAAVLRLIDEEFAAGEIASDAVIRRLLEIMLLEALRTGPSPSAAPAGLSAALADPRLARAVRALHADLDRAWTLEQLAAIAGMSRSRFADRFARCIGLTPLAYLSAWRLTCARRELAATNRQVKEIASRAGYASVSAFSNAFRRTVGVGPARYRHMASETNQSGSIDDANQERGLARLRSDRVHRPHHRSGRANSDREP